MVSMGEWELRWAPAGSRAGAGAFLKEALCACEAKSGLHRATCRLTAGGAGSKPVPRMSATENIPPAGPRIRR